MTKLVCPFWVNKVDALPINAASALTLSDLLYCDVNDQEEIWSYVVLANYMIDTQWLFHTVPSLLQTKQQLVIISGEKGYANTFRSSSFSKHINADKIRIIEPALPLPFGIHHSKLILCVNARGVRVAVLTANFIHDDWAYKTQGIYVQDFPKFSGLSANNQMTKGVFLEAETRGDRFKNELRRYLNYYGIISNNESKVSIPSTLFDEIDFSAANVEIITSIPGYHRFSDRDHFGLGRIPGALHSIDLKSSEGIQPSFLIWQFSSQGKLTASFIKSLENAMITEGKPNEEINKGELSPVVQVVYPTETEVRESLEGWRGGLSLPLRLSCCHPYINERLHRWGKKNTEGLSTAMIHRTRALPHIKTYIRLNEEKNGIKWCILTSANLSRAAWGEWQKGGTQLAIRSYEFGVLYGKDSFVRFSDDGLFSITPSRPILPPALVEGDGLVEVHIDPGGGQTLEKGPVLFLPYNPLHPEPYTSTIHIKEQRNNNSPYQISTDDIPWVIDMPHIGKDVFGNDIRRAMDLDCQHIQTNTNISNQEKSRNEVRVLKRGRKE